MAKSARQTIAALRIATMLGIATISSCVIRIGTGSDETNQTSDLPSETGSGSGTQPPPPTPEEELADAVNNTDPLILAENAAIANYAAATHSALVESQFINQSVDEQLAAQLFDEYAALAQEQAAAWYVTIDPSTIPFAGHHPKFECINAPTNCKPTTFCPFNGDGAMCIVTDCGTGKCPYCLPGFGNILYNGWCQYQCYIGAEYAGAAYILKTHWGTDEGPVCIPKLK